MDLDHIKVYVVLWPTKDERSFYVLYVRQNSKGFQGMVLPDFADPLPVRELKACIKLHLDMGLTLYEDVNRPGLRIFAPPTATRLDVLKAEQTILEYLGNPASDTPIFHI